MAAATLFALLGAACSSDDDDSLTLYSGRGEEFVEPVIEAFEEETGIDVEARYGDTADLALLLEEEGDRTPAEVFFAQGPGAVGFLASSDRLATLPESLTERIVPRFVDPERRWIGVSGRQRVLVYNTDEVDEADLPASIDDVIGERYAGRVAVAPTNGSFQDFVTAFRTIRGNDEAGRWLTALADGGAPSYASNGAIVEAVSRGEVPMGLVNHYYALRFLREDPDLPIANHSFAPGDLGNLFLPATASILAGSEGDENALAFVEFLLGDEAQAHFSDGTEDFEYPLVQGESATEGLTPLEELEPPTYDFGSLSDLRATAELISESGLE